MTEDPAGFLADWGEPATIDGHDVVLIFSAPYRVVPIGEAGMASDEPHALLPTASVPARPSAPDADSVLLFPAIVAPRMHRRYFVREVQPDGTGWTSLTLEIHPVQV
jgi:hypothetical protein